MTAASTPGSSRTGRLSRRSMSSCASRESASAAAPGAVDVGLLSVSSCVPPMPSELFVVARRVAPPTELFARWRGPAIAGARVRGCRSGAWRASASPVGWVRVSGQSRQRPGRIDRPAHSRGARRGQRSLTRLLTVSVHVLRRARCGTEVCEPRRGRPRPGGVLTVAVARPEQPDGEPERERRDQHSGHEASANGYSASASGKANSVYEWREVLLADGAQQGKADDDAAEFAHRMSPFSRARAGLVAGPRFGPAALPAARWRP